MEKRRSECFQVNRGLTERLRNSSLICRNGSLAWEKENRHLQPVNNAMITVVKLNHSDYYNSRKETRIKVNFNKY